MYKDYKIGPFWEAVIAGFAAVTALSILRVLGTPAAIQLIGAFVGLFVAVYLLEVTLPRFRFDQAAAQLKQNPDTQPIAHTPREIVGELISEGPTFDREIGRKQSKN